MATRTISVLGGNWDATTAWTEGAVPVGGDDVVATALSGNLVVNVITANLNSFDLTGYTGTLTNSGTTPTINVVGTNGQTTNFRLAGIYSATGLRLNCYPASGATVNFTSGGKSIYQLYFVGNAAGISNLQDAVTVTTTFVATRGTVNTNGNAITAPFINISGTATRAFNCTNSTITLSDTATPWVATTTTNLTFTSTGSTINIIGTNGTFAGGGLTYNVVTFSGDNITITGNNIFATLNINNAGLATGLIFTINSITTVTAFATNGYVGNLAKILSTSAGSHFHLTTASTQISEDYMSIKDCTVDQANTWYAGANSTDVSGNSGWIFTAPPSPPTELSLSESLSVLSSHLCTRTSDISISESLTSNDDDIVQSILFPVLADSISSDDGIASQTVFSIALPESASGDDLLLLQSLLQGLLPESASSDDGNIVQSILYPILSEFASSDDLLLLQLVLSAVLSESIGVDDIELVLSILYPVLANSISSDDVITFQSILQGLILESLSADDDLIVYAKLYPILPESIGVDDNLLVTTNYTWVKLIIAGNETFAIGDVLRIKDNINDEWFTVVNNVEAPTYHVVRDKANAYSVDNNPAWKKGASVVNYGKSGDGGVLLTSSDPNAPHVSIFTHAGSPWSSLTTRLRMGNLNGFLGYVANKYGIAIGETDKYLKYDPDGGLQLKGVVIATAGSNVINTYYQVSTPTTNLNTGDIWIDSDATPKGVYRYNGATWDLIAIDASVWEHASDVTKIDGGDIYTGSITATVVGTTELIANTANIKNGIITSAKIGSAEIKEANIDSLAVTTAKINSLAVETAKVANQAITIPVSTYSSAGQRVDNAGAGGRDLVQAAITSTGAPIHIVAGCLLSAVPVADTYALRIKRDSTFIYDSGNIGGNAFSTLLSGMIADTPGSGSYTYTLNVYSPASIQVDAYNNSILLLEVKK